MRPGFALHRIRALTLEARVLFADREPTLMRHETSLLGLLLSQLLFRPRLLISVLEPPQLLLLLKFVLLLKLLLKLLSELLLKLKQQVLVR
jgi:hypothetical protein